MQSEARNAKNAPESAICGVLPGQPAPTGSVLWLVPISNPRSAPRRVGRTNLPSDALRLWRSPPPLLWAKLRLLEAADQPVTPLTKADFDGIRQRARKHELPVPGGEGRIKNKLWCHWLPNRPLYESSQFIVFLVRANPSPDERLVVPIITHRPIMIADPDRPEISFERFEMQRRIIRIGQSEAETLQCQLANRRWKLIVTFPEGRSGLGIHAYSRPGKSRNCPALASASACSMSRCNLPPGSASAAIWRSQSSSVHSCK